MHYRNAHNPSSTSSSGRPPAADVLSWLCVACGVVLLVWLILSQFSAARMRSRCDADRRKRDKVDDDEEEEWYQPPTMSRNAQQQLSNIQVRRVINGVGSAGSDGNGNGGRT